MRKIALLLFSLLITSTALADIQARINIFTQQSELFRQICFRPDGTFLQDRIIFEARDSIAQTAMDCNAQALALEEERLAIEAALQDDECVNCYRTITDPGLIDLLNGNAGVVTELTCPGIGDANQCMGGLACNLLTSIIPLGRQIAAATLADHPTLRSCGRTGNCFSNLGRAIWDNLWDTVVGLYDLGSMGVGWLSDQVSSLWRAEDATSTRGIAATETNDSQLSQFLADPIGYVYNFGAQFLNMIVEGISRRYGCAEWTGEPHFSECVRPMSWECADCNEKLNMACGVAGYIGGSFVTNFFTGGAVAAAQIAKGVATATTFAVVRSIPGAARIAETMAGAGRLSRVSGLLTATVRQAWAAIAASRTSQAIVSVARQLRSAGAAVNGFARKRVFLYAQGQDRLIEAAKAYNRLTIASFSMGYQATGRAANAARDHLYSLYPRLSDVTGGAYARVRSPEDYLREATRGMPAAEREHMGVVVTRDANGNQRVIVFDRRAGNLDSAIRFDFTERVPATAPLPRAPVAAADDAAEAEAVITVTGTRRAPDSPYLTESGLETALEDIQAMGLRADDLASTRFTPEMAERLADSPEAHVLTVNRILGRDVDLRTGNRILDQFERRGSQALDPAAFRTRQLLVREALEDAGMTADEAARQAERLFATGTLGRAPPVDDIARIIRETSVVRLRSVDSLEDAVDDVVEAAETISSPARTEYINRWGTRSATTTEENLEYINIARVNEHVPGQFFLDTQNSALKYLNDTLKNKGLVDALGNRYNAMVQEALAEFQRLNPGLSLNMYSDYKSLRAAIRGPPGQEDALMAQLGRMIDGVDQRFLAEVRAAGIVEEQFLTERWFRAGIGRTGDEANLVTRFSRREGDLPTTSFDSPAIQARISNAWQLAQTTRAQLANRFRGTRLLDTVDGTNNAIPTAEVLEVVRKNSDAAEVARILSGRFGVNVTAADAQMLRRYFDQVDQFSPGLLIPSRVEHRFDQATQGGFSVDFAGVGSFNAAATARGLAEGTDLASSIRAVRNREVLVTRELDALKARTEAAVEQVLARHGIAAEITISGDDMLVVPNRVLTAAVRRELTEAMVAAQRGTSTAPAGMRTSFFREGIPDQAARSVQATIGESVEKKLRKHLEGILTPDELRQTHFAVDMRGTSPGTGSVGLEVVNPALSPERLAIIRREFATSIEDVNADLRATGAVGQLTP